MLTARHIHGRELSYNNLLDLDSALAIARSFGQPAAAVIKHNNPCGAATCAKLSLATRKALDGDPVSAFGSVLGFNRTVDIETAEILVEPNRFIEAIVAPDFEAGAVGVLTTRPKWRDNVRLMQVGQLPAMDPELSIRFLSGGALVQEADTLPAMVTQWRTVTDVPVADALWDDIYFAWEMVRHVKSNAIVLARDTSLVGVGAGQMSRVDSVEIAIRKAGDRSAGCILSSDAFFPFPDSIEAAARAGVVAIVQPADRGATMKSSPLATCIAFRWSSPVQGTSSISTILDKIVAHKTNRSGSCTRASAAGRGSTSGRASASASRFSAGYQWCTADSLDCRSQKGESFQRRHSRGL